MIGNPAISVLCDAYSKGIRSYDIDKAYRYALNTSRLFGNNEAGYTPGSISHTLEYAYSDWCMARLAEWLGKEEDKTYFDKRAATYSTIYDPAYGWFRQRVIKVLFRPCRNRDDWRKDMVVWRAMLINKVGLFPMM